MLRKINRSSINDVYLQLVENEVAKLVSIEDLVQTLDSVKKGESWKISESSKRKEFLKEFFKPHNDELYKFLGIDFHWD